MFIIRIDCGSAAGQQETLLHGGWMCYCTSSFTSLNSLIFKAHSVSLLHWTKHMLCNDDMAKSNRISRHTVRSAKV